jgi:hypothetical protein
MPCYRFSAADSFRLTVAAAYLLGVAFIAALPPWEGFDEVAHYSYAQQLADGFGRPTLQEGRISTTVESFAQRAPTPYLTVPPFDRSFGDLTYRRWFESGNANGVPAHAAPSAPRVFAPGSTPNWQAQHPPLFYLIMAPLVAGTSGLSIALQLFILRTTCWSLAFLGYVIAIKASHRAVPLHEPALRKHALAAGVLWPFLHPGFFPEFARFGNDSLVVLLTSCLWWLATSPPAERVALRWYVATGIVLGLGAATKVTFLPLAAVTFLWLAWQVVASVPGGTRSLRIAGIATTATLFLLLAAWVYVSHALDRLSITGLAHLSHPGLTLDRVLRPLWSEPIEVLRGLAGMAMTFAWGSTASSAYPPAVFVLPLLAPCLMLLPCAFIAWRGRSIPAGNVPISIMLTLGVFGGLFYFLLARIALTHFGSGAPGWYLHVLVGPLTYLCCIGWAWLEKRLSWIAIAVRFQAAYAGLFMLVVAWMQVTLFTGITFKTATSKTYNADDWRRVLDVKDLLTRLGLLAFPSAACLLGMACILALAAVAVLPRYKSSHCVTTTA